MSRRAFVLPLFLLCAVAARAAAPVLELPLRSVEDEALRRSQRALSAEQAAAAAEDRARSQRARLGPKLSLDATYRHVSEVAEFQPVPAAAPVRLGDNKNYSVGPMVAWNVWDGGATYHGWRSQQAIAGARRADYDAAKVRARQAARLSYFQVQLALEQMRLLADSLKLAQAQYRDISLRHKAGASSRIDALSAHQEVLSRRRDFRQAQTDLALALRELFALTGLGGGLDASLPMEDAVAAELPENTEPPTLLVKLEDVDRAKAAFGAADSYRLDLTHPDVRSLDELVRGARQASRAAGAGHWPAFQVSAKTSRDYPNGPKLEEINQNTVNLSANLPLFEWGRVTRDVDEQKALALSYERRREQSAIDLAKEWDKARDEIRGLEAQQKVNREAVRESDELAKLIYDSYKAGTSTFLEVQSANLRQLQSKVRVVSTDIQILIQFAILDSLSTRSGS